MKLVQVDESGDAALVKQEDDKPAAPAEMMMTSDAAAAPSMEPALEDDEDTNDALETPASGVAMDTSDMEPPTQPEAASIKQEEDAAAAADDVSKMDTGESEPVDSKPPVMGENMQRLHYFTP